MSALVLFFLPVCGGALSSALCSAEQATAADAARGRCRGASRQSAGSGVLPLRGNRGQGEMPHPQHATKCSHREHRAW